MKEFVKKLISKLEEERNKAGKIFNKYLDEENLSCIFDMSDIAEKRLSTLNDVISIVKQLIESYDDGWIKLTDDEESYPECFEYVLVEDEYGDKNIACCYPDYDWYISNCENSIRLIGKVIKWKKLDI